MKIAPDDGQLNAGLHGVGQRALLGAV